MARVFRFLILLAEAAQGTPRAMHPKEVRQ